MSHLHFTVRFLVLATRKSANCDSWRVSFHHFLTADFPHLEVKAPLDDAEQILLFGIFVGCDTSVEPSN